jgi:hypothetical protein
LPNTIPTVIPAIEDVRETIEYGTTLDPRVGTLDLPLESDVRNGILYDGETKEGTLYAPKYVAVQNGDWEDPDTWGDAYDYPHEPGDTALVDQNIVVAPNNNELVGIPKTIYEFPEHGHLYIDTVEKEYADYSIRAEPLPTCDASHPLVIASWRIEIPPTQWGTYISIRIKQSGWSANLTNSECWLEITYYDELDTWHTVTVKNTAAQTVATNWTSLSANANPLKPISSVFVKVVLAKYESGAKVYLESGIYPTANIGSDRLLKTISVMSKPEMVVRYPNFPYDSQVQENVTYGYDFERIGILITPSVNDVREGVAVGTMEGNLVVPESIDVREGTKFGYHIWHFGTFWPPPGTPGYWEDEFEGTLDLPTTIDVKKDVIYDNATKIGEYEVLFTLPLESDVREGIIFGTQGEIQIDDMPIMKGWSYYTHTNMYDIENDYYYSVDVLLSVVGPDGHEYIIGTDCEPYDEWCIRWLNGDRPNDGDTLLVSFHDPYEEGDFYNIPMLYEDVDYYDIPFPDEKPFLNNDTGKLYTLIVSIISIPGYTQGINYRLVDDKIEWLTLVQPPAKTVFNVSFTYQVTEPTSLGTLDLPAVNDVRDGILFDNETKEGILDLPVVADVRRSVLYDNETKEGTLAISLPPLETDVRYGVLYGVDASLEGNLELPAEEDVEKDVQYGANGTELTGTFVPSYTGGKIEVDIQNMTYDVQVEVKRKRPT